MRKLIAPIIWLLICIALNRISIRIAPYLVGVDTLAEQLNGTVPVGMWYVAGLESLSTVFNLTAAFCIGWFVSRMITILKERSSHEKH